MKTKRNFPLLALLLMSVPGCTQNDILYEVDNILFYSGETGSEYQYRDRYSIDTDLIESATLNLTIQPRYGKDSLEVWYTDSFTGLDGSDGEADRSLLDSMEDGGMEGWTQITVWDEDNPETSLTERSVSIDVTDALENFAMAFLWDHEGVDVAITTQRHYYVNGDVLPLSQRITGR